MDAILELFDTSAKRWLAVLVASVLISIVFLERSFMNAMAPQENTVTAEQSTSGEAQSRDASDNQVQTVAEGQIVTRVSPFDNQRPTVQTAPKDDPVVHQQIVHQQAEYLRQLIAAGKLPKGFGNLTKEQVDDMEKRGVTIN